MNNFIEFNLNEPVLVKFTDKGFHRLAAIHNEYVGQIPNWHFRTMYHYKGKTDREGYYEMQMWEFMQVFGAYTDHMHQYCDINIRIKTKTAGV